MSTFKHPVGPQPNKVYWRRRLIVGLGALAVLVVIILIVVRPGSSNGASAGTGPTTQPTTHTTAPPSTTIPTTSTSASGAACKPADITVDAITDMTNYGPDQMPELSLAITNNGPTACKINAGTSKQVYTITSGSELYWKSTDCQTGAADAEVLLQPGKTVKSGTPLGWDRTRSSTSTCSAKRNLVPAGGASYHLQTAVDGITSKTTKQFILN